ncbi:MAG TPA: UDP-glucose 4-epimerase GalE [Chloroflexota bacterium]|nr:UDP-glucose 4-epimerase GalE [Chloroflexota bacterium]
MRLLVTGGAGYIGSHTVRELVRAGHEVTVFDNLRLGHRQSVTVPILEGELADAQRIASVLRNGPFEAVLHFAGYALVGESSQDPRKYFTNNVGGSLNLLNAMVDAGVRLLVFSSTSEVYGEAQQLPLPEDHPKLPTNAYGESKWMVEQALRRYSDAYGLRSISLRYFNAAGAAEDGSMGEDHRPETHLIPNAILGALGRKPFQFTCAKVDTPDGTTIRDYIHVLDLASAHVLALSALAAGHPTDAYNVGVGHGYSTREVVETVQRVAGVQFPTSQGDPRPGEPAAKYASNERIRSELGWEPVHDLESMVRTALLWHQKHPEGYRE